MTLRVMHMALSLVEGRLLVAGVLAGPSSGLLRSLTLARSGAHVLRSRLHCNAHDAIDVVGCCAVYPQLSSREMEVSVRQICGYIGVDLDASQVC